MKKKWLVGLILPFLIITPTVLLRAEESNDENSNNENSNEEINDTEENEASEKDELIFSRLNYFGDVEELYATNVFEVPNDSEIIDYGNYEHLELMNTLDLLRYDGAEIQIETDTDRIFTQGTLGEAHSLPWSFDLTYILDGEEIDPDEEIGEAGELMVELETSPADESDEHLMEFFDHFLLEVSVSMTHDTHFNVESEEGVISTSGNQRETQWTVLPEQEETLSFSADTRDLEEYSWEINAAPFSMDVDDDMIELDEMMEEAEELEAGVAELSDGANELQDGTLEMNEGLQELQAGVDEMEEGLLELDAESDTLTEGSAQMLEVLQSINEEVQSLSIEINGLSSILEVSETIEAGLEEVNQVIKEVESNLKGYLSDIEENGLNPENIIEETKQASGRLDELEQTVNDHIDLLIEEEMIDSEEKEEIDQAFDEVSDVLFTNEEMMSKSDQVISEIQEKINGESSIRDTIASIQTEYSEFHTTVESIASRLNELEGYIDEMQAGLNELVVEFAELDEGIQEYTEGVAELITGVQEASEGVAELNEGAEELVEASSELADGANELQEETTNLPEQIEEQVDEVIEDFTNPDYEASSFVDDRNNIDNIQFLIQIDEEEAEEEEPIEEEEEDVGLWERFLDLFRS